MARTSFDIKYSDLQLAKQKMGVILATHNYKEIIEKGETVWKCGIGFLTAMKYIKVEFKDNDMVTISGWIRAVVGPEVELTGTAGAIPKKQVLKVIREIESSIN